MYIAKLNLAGETTNIPHDPYRADLDVQNRITLTIICNERSESNENHNER